MSVVVEEEPMSRLEEYATIPIAFEVTRILEVGATGTGGFALGERPLESPFVKDYDAGAGRGPLAWRDRFDPTGWQLFAAREEGKRVGGAAAVFRAPDLDILEGRSDLAVLWDLRVAPAFRGRGIGEALFRAVEAWALARGARSLKVETQDTNAPACRFYARRGCELRAARRGVYPDEPNELQLLWYKDLGPVAGRSITSPT